MEQVFVGTLTLEHRHIVVSALHLQKKYSKDRLRNAFQSTHFLVDPPFIQTGHIEQLLQELTPAVVDAQLRVTPRTFASLEVARGVSLLSDLRLFIGPMHPWEKLDQLQEHTSITRVYQNEFLRYGKFYVDREDDLEKVCEQVQIQITDWGRW